jgi:hypothetical protein
MKTLKKILYIALEILTLFLAITALLGGLALTANFYTPPVELLQGSPFKNYTLPGLALALIVGGSALCSFILLLRKNKFAVLSASVVGVIIMFFEFVEVMVIGSTLGPAFFLQVIYFGLGIIIMMASLGLWLLDLLALSDESGH